MGIMQLTDDERWAYHAYDYAWRRVMLNEREHNSPIDPDIIWFNEAMVGRAEAMWRRKFNRPLPAKDRTQEHSAEDIAHVEKCAGVIRSNLGDWAKRNAYALGKANPLYVVDEATALEDIKRQLGVRAIPEDPLSGG